MGLLDSTVIAALAFWTLGSLCYVCRSRRWRVFARWNRLFRAWTSWRVFNANDSAVNSGVLELDYRDRGESGEEVPWTCVRDACWSWHAFFWMPERRVANRIYYLIRELAAGLPGAGQPAGNSVPAPARIIGEYLCRIHPPPSGGVREFRLVVRHRPEHSSPATIYSFSIGSDGYSH